MRAILPCAGYGTRMYPLTENFPKPLLDVQGKPVIEYSLSKLERIGISNVSIVTNNRYYGNFLDWTAKSDKFNLRIINDGSNSNEERLGSVRDVYLGLGNDDFIVINPDNLFTFDLSYMKRRFDETKKSVIALYDVIDIDQAKKMGNPVVDSSGRIVSLREKDPNPKSSVCTIGIYFFKREINHRLKEYLDEENPSDRFGDFVSWLCLREKIYSHLFSSADEWFDIGSVDSLSKARKIKDIRRFL